MNLNLNKFWRKRSVTITEYDPTYKVVYLGNVLTAWAKGDGCVDKPLATLWRSYCQSLKPDVVMKVTVCTSGLKATTKEHGLTEYWSNRVTYCVAHQQYPKVFCWVYRHEGRKLKQELRCHAVLCAREETARQMAAQLRNKLTQALYEFRREKICRQNARLSLANCVYDNPSLPRRKILLSTGTVNYRPPVDRCRSAPRLVAIEEAVEEPEADAGRSSHVLATGNAVGRRQSAPAVTFWMPGNIIITTTGGTSPRLVQKDVGGLPPPRRHSTERIDNKWLIGRTTPLDFDSEEDDDEEEEEDDIDDQQETTSDIVADDDALSDQFGNEPEAVDADSIEESPAGRTQHLASIDETTAEDEEEEGVAEDDVGGRTVGSLKACGDVRADEDNISDESGYSEENERDFICKM